MTKTIQLKNEAGEIIAQLCYGNKTRKEVIIATWRKRYGEKFKDLTVVDLDRPDGDEKAVKPEKSPWKDGVKAHKINRSAGRMKPTQGGRIW